MSTSSPPPKPADNILSYDSNVMLAAIISLLVVILFVLLLHIYAKWFLFRARWRSRSVPATHHHHHFHSFAIDAAHAASPTKGLESSAISSIPVFVFSSNNDEVIDECAICLSVFEAGELCRRLPGCSHAFHVECIDMWFQSHSTCPICRSCPVSTENGNDTDTTLLPEVQLEIVVDDDRVRNAEIELCRAPPSSSSSSAAAAVGESVKRMMSRNRSERKIHPSEAPVDSQV